MNQADNLFTPLILETKNVHGVEQAFMPGIYACNKGTGNLRL
jgi:hypothetical protein